MTDASTVATGPVTCNCAVGNHLRCLGQVTTTKGMVPCGCAVADCGHGSDTVKARRRDNA